MNKNHWADVAVAVATLDRPGSLARCLDAILAGEVLPAELIVVDQGDDDQTESVVAERTTTVLQILHIKQERLGLSASRNVAVARARSPIVAVTDDDCVPSGGWVAAIQEILVGDSNAFAAVTGPVLPLEPDEERIWPVSSRTNSARVDFSGTAPPWRVGTGANFAIRREWLTRIGRYDERLGAGTQGRAGEDMDIIHRLLGAGGRIRYEPRAVVYHERQSTRRRKTSRSAYGHGIGAYAAIRLRHGELRGLTMIGQWLVLRGRLLGRALVKGQLGGVREELLVLGGTVRGAAYGLRAASPESRPSSKDS